MFANICLSFVHCTFKSINYSKLRCSLANCYSFYCYAANCLSVLQCQYHKKGDYYNCICICFPNPSTFTVYLYCKTLIIRVTLFSRCHYSLFIRKTIYSRFTITSSMVLTLEIIREDFIFASSCSREFTRK